MMSLFGEFDLVRFGFCFVLFLASTPVPGTCTLLKNGITLNIGKLLCAPQSKKFATILGAQIKFSKNMTLKDGGEEFVF